MDKAIAAMKPQRCTTNTVTNAVFLIVRSIFAPNKLLRFANKP